MEVKFYDNIDDGMLESAVIIDTIEYLKYINSKK